jgi:hypothetical protein
LPASFAANAAVNCSAKHLAEGKKRMPPAQRGKTETDRAIDYIARVLEDCKKLRRDMREAASPSPLAKRRDKPSAKRAGRVSKK